MVAAILTRTMLEIWRFEFHFGSPSMKGTVLKRRCLRIMPWGGQKVKTLGCLLCARFVKTTGNHKSLAVAGGLQPVNSFVGTQRIPMPSETLNLFKWSASELDSIWPIRAISLYIVEKFKHPNSIQKGSV